MGLWSVEHAQTLIPSTVAMVIIGIILRLAIGRKDLKIRMIPFQILAFILFAIEIGKQLVSLSRGYDLYHLPFHFCSLFIFMLPIMALYNGKHANTVRGITAALCGSVFLLMLIYPCLIYGAGDITNYFTEYMSFHTVTFHNIVMLEFVLIVALGLHTPNPKKEQKAVIIFTLVFSIVAAVMAHLLKTNYANMYTCNIPPLEAVRVAVRDSIGELPATLLYVSIVAVLNILFVYMCYWLYRWLRLAVKSKEEKAE